MSFLITAVVPILVKPDHRFSVSPWWLKQLPVNIYTLDNFQYSHARNSAWIII